MTVNNAIESQYASSFREEEIDVIGEKLRFRHSIELIGMKRVGINNLLRFFFSHKSLQDKYLSNGEQGLFIFVDLNDLIERELFSFWRLTLKRIVDAVDASDLEKGIKDKLSAIFLRCIQSGDIFLTYDGVRESLQYLVKHNVYPTIFFSRFDRIKESVSLEFFHNLQSLRDATDDKLVYVFTNFRTLSQLAPSAFDKKSFAIFFDTIYIKPVKDEDIKVILRAYASYYDISLSDEIMDSMVTYSGGHLQYLQTYLVILQKMEQREEKITKAAFIKHIENDERIMLLGEELWESLTQDEQEILPKIVQKEELTDEERQLGTYLWETGMVIEDKEGIRLFNPIFALYVQKKGTTKDSSDVDMSKKEHMLFSLLKEHTGDICEREKIIEIVWPEYKEYGVSDWSIDRLVARVRGKLKKQKSPYEIITVRTRGYKLVAA